MFRNNKKDTIHVSKRKDSRKGKRYVFNGYKQRNKVWLVYLECKLLEDTYG